ncbi:hypothetical protein ABIF78_000941 [Bradyrhizobium japonicum]|uniref:hypothetical protein n=2 Tax=Nitrobacteraceae TaxID=41294 RepID=UPI00138B1790|nr:hypothetical protein [Bradyrhizobium japonicum]
MLRDSEIVHLTEALERSKERRKTWFGERKTSAAEAAEAVLLAYVPALLAEARDARMVKRQFKAVQ